MAGRLPKNRRAKPADLVAAYSEGLEGWIWNRQVEREWNQFCEESQNQFGAAVQDLNRTGKQRVMLWRSREKYDPGAFGKESQATGDCVSHGARSARDVTRSVEIDIKGEGEIYFRRGATEPTYGMRGHSGEGMNPAAAARFERDFGFLVRKKYDEIDLRKYDASIGMKWGRNGTPNKIKELCKQHNVGSVAHPSSLDEAKDLLANGYAAHSGQSWGTARKLGSDGLNTKSASWGHDMATVGYDDTSEIWTEPVVFVANSWASWNSLNPRWDEDALGPWIKGMIVIPEEEYERYFIKSGSIHHYSNINGFPAQQLPDWGFDSYV